MAPSAQNSASRPPPPTWMLPLPIHLAPPAKARTCTRPGHLWRPHQPVPPMLAPSSAVCKCPSPRPLLDQRSAHACFSAPRPRLDQRLGRAGCWGGGAGGGGGGGGGQGGVSRAGWGEQGGSLIELPGPSSQLIPDAAPAQDVAGQGRAGQGRAGQGRAGQGRAGQGRAISRTDGAIMKLQSDS